MTTKSKNTKKGKKGGKKRISLSGMKLTKFKALRGEWPECPPSMSEWREIE